MFFLKVGTLHWQSHFSTEKHEVRCEACRRLHRRPIGDENNGECEVPVFSCVCDVDSEKLNQRSVYSIYLTDALQMVRYFTFF